MDSFVFLGRKFENLRFSQEPVQSIDLGNLQQLQKNSETYPKNGEEGAFSFDVREQKDIVTYYLCAASAQEKEMWIASMVAWRKYFTNLQSGKGTTAAAAAATASKEEVAMLRKQLLDAQEQISELESVVQRLRADLTEAVGGTGGGNEKLEQEIAELREELEEETAQKNDYKRKLLETRQELKKLQAK